MADGDRVAGMEDLVEPRNLFLERLHTVDPEILPALEQAEQLQLIHSTIDLLRLESARRLAVFDSSQAFLELGEHSTIDWMRARAHVSAASADSQLALARQLPELEPTVEAVELGQIGFEHPRLQ